MGAGDLVLSENVDTNWKAIIIPTVDNEMYAKTDGGWLESELFEAKDMFRQKISFWKNAQMDLGFKKWYRVDPSTICQYTGLGKMD